MSRILIVDDEPSICWSLKEGLTDQGHEVQVAASIERANKILNQFSPDLIVLDVRLPGQDGLSAIPDFRQRFPSAPIIVITAFGDLQSAVDAIRGNAFEYLVKPFELSAFFKVVNRALISRSRSTENVSKNDRPSQLIGHGSAMQAVFKQIAVVSTTDFPVLITGETGTGKEVVAAAIHEHGQRCQGPFIRISLASLSPSVIESELFGHVKGAFTGAEDYRPGIFELAENGTIFLDEIGETPPSIQVKLLRVLESRCFTPVGTGEERPTNARLIAATNRDLEKMMTEGTFREDLFHRLRVFSINLPPLRSRREDLRPLVEYFLTQRAPMFAPYASDDFWQAIEHRNWNGNVRELRNAVDHAVVMSRGGPLTAEHLPSPASASQGEPERRMQLQSAIVEWLREQLDEPASNEVNDLYRRFLTVAEPALFEELLVHTRQNRSAAAKMLGLDRATLRGKMGQDSA